MNEFSEFNKQELSFRPESSMKWLEKTWNFERSSTDFELNLHCLNQTPASIAECIAHFSAEQLTATSDHSWSVNENIGHLLTMESLWIARLDDFVMGNPVLRPWNGTNADTVAGQFNRQRAQKILDDFEEIRSIHLKTLSFWKEKQLSRTCFHERLQKNMTLADHVYFMKEHDLYHLNIIKRTLIEK